MRISLIHQAALGDTVLLLPLIRSLRMRFAEGRITLVSHTNLGQMFTMMGFVDGFAAADDREHSKWFIEPEKAGAANSSPAWADCDLLISAVSDGADAWARNARASIESRKSKTEKALFFFNPRPPADYPRHVTDFQREQLADLDLAAAPVSLPRSNPDGPILIHPGSGGQAKCWPREKYLALAEALKRNGILPTFILGEAEQDLWGYPAIRLLKDAFPTYLHMGLFELGEKMGRARLFLGNDAGVSHLAAALGLPTITLWGPSNDIQWRPVGPQVSVLRAPPPHEKDLTKLEESTVMAALMAELRKLA